MTRIHEGCDSLVRSLDDLLKEAGAVRRSLGEVGVGSMRIAFNPTLEDSVVDMTTLVAETLTDVSDRLRVVHELITELRNRRRL